MATIDKPTPWYIGAPVHGILLVGAVFFVLPLVWMIATSFKPLEQTLRVPDSVSEALFGMGHRATIDGTEYDVTLERPIAPSAEEPYWIVRPLESFLAGEMTHPFGPEVWGKYPIFNEEELRRMNAPVTPELSGLAGIADPNRLVVTIGMMVCEIDPASGAKVASFTTSRQAYGVALVDGEIYVSEDDGVRREVRVYARGGGFKRSMGLGFHAIGLGGDETGPMPGRQVPKDVNGRLFAVDTSTDKIRELDPATGKPVFSFAAPEALEETDGGLAFDGESLFYLRRFGSTLWRLSPDTGAVTQRYQLTFGNREWRGLATLGGKIYIADYDGVNAQIHEFDPSTGSLARTLTLDLGTRVLADRKNPFQSENGDERGVLKLRSGREVRAELVRAISSPPGGEKLWLVREWRSEDTDTKEVGSTAGDITRAWAVLPESETDTCIREIPQNYPAALDRVNFGWSLLNTLFLCAMTVCGVVFSSLVVAYGFAFIEFRGRELLFKVTLATMMIPFPIVMVPMYLLYREFGWVGTFKPLWVWAWFGNAFFIFLLRQFFLGLPRDLMDAARIDGCSELEILWHVVVPLSKPAIAMVALFQFLGTWKDFMGPLIYLNNKSQFTLSLSLQAFSSEHGGTPWHLLMAASTVFSLPLIILFFFAVRTFIRSVAMTGMKG